MKYQLKGFNRNITEEELLTDLKRVATELGTNALSSREYNDSGGKYNAGTIGARFGSWNAALIKAGLQLVHQREVSSNELLKNIEQVWISVGRQPVFRDMKSPTSKYSTHQYIVKFGTWIKALEAFIKFASADDAVDENPKNLTESTQVIKQIVKHQTKRFPSARLKVQVLMRDGNKCRLCGITVTGENIHFDHIKPWSKGGETVLENLQVLCELHNLAKGNLDYEPN